MIFDQMTGALYGDDGKFLKAVRCPLALRSEHLKRISNESPDRYCSSCGSTVRSIDQFSDLEMKAVVAESSSVCIFATPKAKHIVFLHPIGAKFDNYRNLPIVQTMRSLEAMADAQANDHTLIFKNTSELIEQGEDKFIVYQHGPSGRLWWSGDYRSDKPSMEDEKSDMNDWKLIRSWFYARSDRPFPLAAYAVPAGIAPNTKVFLEDLIEDYFQTTWNQGNAQRRISSEATWDGFDFTIDQPEEPMICG